jgi:hypothetical protein
MYTKLGSRESEFVKHLDLASNMNDLRLHADFVQRLWQNGYLYES